MGGIEAFGRDEELEVIRAFASGDGLGALVLEGEAGIGKTTLWRAAVDAEVAEDRIVLVARPSQAEATLGFSGLADLFAVALDTGGTGLPEPQANALDTALLLKESKLPVDLRALSAGVLGVLRSLSAGQPVTVAIDDIQWFDEASASALAFALRRLTDEPVHLVAALRTTADGDSPVIEALPPESLTIPIGPLSSGALHRAIKEHIGGSLPRPVLLRVHEVAGGNPFYGLEMARVILQSGVAKVGTHIELPPSLEAVVRARLQGLPAGVLRAIEPAALLAAPSVVLLEAISNEPVRLGERLDRAAAAGVVAIEDDRIRFTHPLLAEGAAEMIGPRRRTQLHRRLAELIDDPVERAGHLALGTTRPDSVAAAAVEEGARLALARGAPASAVELYERAADLTPNEDRDDRWRRMIEAGRACRAAGFLARGKQLMASCLDALPSGVRRADALFILASLADDLAAGMRALDEAIVHAAGDPTRLSAFHRERSTFLFAVLGDARAALEESRAALEAAEQHGESDLAPWLAQRCFYEAVAGRITPGLLERALVLQERSPIPLEYSDSPRWVQGLRWMLVDRLAESRAAFEAELAEAERRGDETTCTWVSFHLVEVECRAGKLDVARARAAEGWLRQEQLGEVYQVGLPLFESALVAAHSGFVDEARSAAERGIAVSIDMGNELFVIQNRAALGFLELSMGNPVAADRVLRALPPQLVELGWDEPSSCPAWPNAIEALVALGELPLAREYLDLYQERAERCDCPWALATAARCLGLIRSAEGDAGRAFEAFEHALVEHRRTPGPFERGRTLLCYGVALRRAKRWGDARSRMEEAVVLFEDMGARLWVERAREERARIGGRRRSGSELTPTEEQVARLVASGNANSQVAAELFVSVRTVESNLTRIYAKLGVKSRTELAARFAAAEEVPS